MTNGVDDAELFRSTAAYVERLLRLCGSGAVV
jgi:hypothetical protein